MQAFVKRPRLANSTPEWDHLEVEWWDNNAAHIERIWGLTEPLCRAARQTYFEDVRTYFLDHLALRPVRILEVGCGTGWSGRLLASPAIRVVGIDFSKQQIEIARAIATTTKSDNCHYVQMEIGQVRGSFQSGEFDGVFTHCAIHHLSTAELTNFAELLSKNQKGFPVAMIEPVYLGRSGFIGSIFGKILNLLYRLLQPLILGRRPEQDEDVIQATQKLVDIASKNGWFLSPKEVPFDVEEIDRLFSACFEIKEIAPVTYFGLRAAQHLATFKDQERASRIAARVLPLFNWIDHWLIKTGLLPHLTDDFLFCSIVLSRK